MTADKTTDMNGQEQDQALTKSVVRKRGRKRLAARAASAKRGRSATTRVSAVSRKTARISRTARGAGGAGVTGGTVRSRRRITVSRGAASVVGSGIAARVLSRGRQAAGDAYEWATEGASRAMPLASRLPDQRMVQRFVDQRPYMLGAIGLGIGAIIGLMLPSPLSLRGGLGVTRGRGRSRP